VNTIVVLEVFYLFSVRYLQAPSLTWQGILGTRRVLIGVGAVIVAQVAITYRPLMQTVFDTRAVSPSDGAVVVATGIVLLLILEGEKRLWPRPRHSPPAPRPG
jgi:magnesium-transporting ATPase (P-type)